MATTPHLVSPNTHRLSHHGPVEEVTAELDTRSENPTAHDIKDADIKDEAVIEILPGSSSPPSTLNEISPSSGGLSSAMMSIGSSSCGSLQEKEHPLPSKRSSRLLRYLRHNFFSLYRRLFTLVFTVNMAIFLGYVIKHHRALSTKAALSDVVTAVSANLMIGILFRQEHVINFLYSICCSFPISTPFFLRRRLAKVYEFGGLHSGCSTASVAWFLLFTGLATRATVTGELSSVAVLVITYSLYALLLAILVSAHPRFRAMQHDSFEAIHRYAGWSSLGLFWAFVFVFSNVLRKETGQKMGQVLVKNASFWHLIVISLNIIYPWARMQKVSVEPEWLSAHATRLHFNYRWTRLPPFAAIRITDTPLKDWHAFATITEPTGNRFSMIVSNAGDWTKRQIEKQPTSIWVRGAPIYGVLKAVALFRKVVVVGTGSGIGPCLALFVDSKVPTRVVWSTRTPRQTYGQGIIDAVRKADDNALIIDTTTDGRPDMVAITYKLYKESGAEAVFVISNPKLTRKIVYGMESRGVPAYGPVFDS
ncbi:MAG: hypothetical protein M1812_005666 [Candelaria pacifica]|nr:MAG: hypothetical protein M1812_005666 [Candelaria pacifica]